MSLLEKIRERWINFVTPQNEDKPIGSKKYEVGTLYFPLSVETDDEKYDTILEAAKILDKDIKVCKPKSKSKSKNKSK
jgi:hypothetical protein